MEKKDLDLLYHLLRLSAISNDEEESQGVQAIAWHLTTKGGHYTSLLEYLEYYGTKYILPKAMKALIRNEVEFTRVVELGAGSGWLAEGLSERFNLKYSPLLIDKRPCAGIVDEIGFYQLDLEELSDLGKLLTLLKPKDLIVCCEFFHCIGHPDVVLKALGHAPMLVIEYDPQCYRYGESYMKQLKMFGANPVTEQDIRTWTLPRKVISEECYPYKMLLIGRR